MLIKKISNGALPYVLYLLFYSGWNQISLIILGQIGLLNNVEWALFDLGLSNRLCQEVMSGVGENNFWLFSDNCDCKVNGNNITLVTLV